MPSTTVKGNAMLTDGPPRKYIFGTKNFDITRWNLQADAYMEEYWQRFCFEVLESRSIIAKDYETILEGLLSQGVTFWKTTSKNMNAETWRDLKYYQVTDMKQLREKIRSPVQSAKSRVVQSLKRQVLQAVPCDIPNPGFGRIPLPQGQAAAVPVPSAVHSAPIAPASETPAPIGLLSGKLFLEIGEPFKYIVGTEGFTAVTHWDQQVYEFAMQYWKFFSSPTAINGQSLENASTVFHEAMYAREVTFFKAGDGPRHPLTRELLPVRWNNWQEFDYRKMKNDDEIHDAIYSLMEFTRSRTLLAWPVGGVHNNGSSPTGGIVSSDAPLSSGSSFHGLSLKAQDLRSDSLMQGDLISINGGTVSAATMVSAAPFPSVDVNVTKSRRRADPPEESKVIDDLGHRHNSMMADGTSFSNYTASVSALREESQLSGMSQDLSNMSVVDEMFDREINSFIRKQQLDP